MKTEVDLFPAPDQASGQAILRLRTDPHDRSVYQFLERVLPIVTLLFAFLILLEGGDRLLLSTLIFGYGVVNVGLSKLISRASDRHAQPLEMAKNIVSAVYGFVAIAGVASATYFWTLHYLPIARSMLAFQSRAARMFIVLLFGCSAAAAEIVAGGEMVIAAQPFVLLLAPGIVLDVLFRFFERRLGQEQGNRQQLESALQLSSRMEAVGYLAAGIAHEINTPVQYVSDSAGFVRLGALDLLSLREEYRKLVDLATAGDLEGVEAQKKHVESLEVSLDAAYLAKRIPVALRRMVEGLERVTEIVSSVRRISHPGAGTFRPEDLNESIRATVRVTSSAWKDVAEIQMTLGELPLLECHIGELHQVFMNLLVNSAHAIRERHEPGSESGAMGFIRIESRCVEEEIEVLVADNGRGVSPEVLGRIFDPFFTTKETGVGTGQGLAMVKTVICDHLEGSVTAESVLGVGTAILIQLPTQRSGGLG